MVKRIGAISMALVLAFGFTGQALAGFTLIEKVKDETKNSVTLKIAYTKYKKKKVKVKIYIKNLDNNKKVTKEVSGKLGSKGTLNIVISNLKKDTEYEFKGKIKQSKKGAKYSDYSDVVKGETED